MNMTRFSRWVRILFSGILWHLIYWWRWTLLHIISERRVSLLLGEYFRVWVCLRSLSRLPRRSLFSTPVNQLLHIARSSFSTFLCSGGTRLSRRFRLPHHFPVGDIFTIDLQGGCALAHPPGPDAYIRSANPYQAHSAMAFQDLEDLLSNVSRVEAHINFFEYDVLELRKDLIEVFLQPHKAMYPLVDASFWSRLDGMDHPIGESVRASTMLLLWQAILDRTCTTKFFLSTVGSHILVVYNQVKDWMMNGSGDVGGDAVPTSSGAAATSHWERRLKTPVESSHPHDLTAQAGVSDGNIHGQRGD